MGCALFSKVPCFVLVFHSLVLHSLSSLPCPQNLSPPSRERPRHGIEDGGFLGVPRRHRPDRHLGCPVSSGHQAAKKNSLPTHGECFPTVQRVWRYLLLDSSVTLENGLYKRVIKQLLRSRTNAMAILRSICLSCWSLQPTRCEPHRWHRPRRRSSGTSPSSWWPCWVRGGSAGPGPGE